MLSTKVAALYCKHRLRANAKLLGKNAIEELWAELVKAATHVVVDRGGRYERAAYN
jgi:hypothetical protein